MKYFFPVPSRFEPCGLTDVEALFKGGQPIAPRIGGLVKGKNTINYATNNSMDQASDLGWAIDQSLKLFHNYHDLFLRRQLAASQEDFSLERHLEQALQNQRVEIYYRIIVELDQLVGSGKINAETAQNYLLSKVLGAHPDDCRSLIKSLGRVLPSSRSPLMEWVIEHR